MSANMTMKEAESVTKGRSLRNDRGEAASFHVKRDGKTFYFCSDHCRQEFLSTPKDKSEAAVDNTRTL